MLRLKNRKELTYNSFLICLIEGCQEKALKLWSTEVNLIDVCKLHYDALEAEKYTT